MSSGTGVPVWVVLPTYDEAENITSMLAALTRVFDTNSIDGTVLVVDDGSPDGTADLADRFAQGDDRVRVLRRTLKEGLGPAYRAGFRLARPASSRWTATSRTIRRRFPHSSRPPTTPIS